MSVFDIVITVLLAILCLITIVFDIASFRSWAKAKEKNFIGNWADIIFRVLLAVMFLLRPFSVITVLFLVTLALTTPLAFTCLSPEGMRNAFGLNPVSNLSYEYKKNNISIETLYIYAQNKPKAAAYNLGIKKPKTVKMLADWYGKHGYENPLTK